MSAIKVLKYLCGTTFLCAVILSFVTVVPELERLLTIALMLFAGASILFAIAAFWMKKRLKEH